MLFGILAILFGILQIVFARLLLLISGFAFLIEKRDIKFYSSKPNKSSILIARFVGVILVLAGMLHMYFGD